MGESVSTRLAQARKARDLTQSQVIAEMIRRSNASGMSIAAPASLKMLLSTFENGRREVKEPYCTLFRAIYGMTDAELFGPVAPSADDREQAEYEALAERIFASQRVNADTAAMLAQQTHYIRTLDCTVGAASLVDQMTSHLATIQDALSHAILPSIRRPLASVLADAAALAAWQALDVGAITRAWQHHETARYAALEARDPVLLAHAMAQQAFVLVEVGEAAAAVQLVSEAQREAGSNVPARFRAWLHAAEGEVAAAIGKTADTERCFDLAAGLLPHGPDAVDPDMPFIVLNDAHLARWRGNALARLGSPDAIADLFTALNGDGTVSDRGAASLRCDLAQALARIGEHQEARIHAVEARRAARRAGSVRQRRRIERLALD
jgi:transcriptional regulator with XRE-family HTH domain